MNFQISPIYIYIKVNLVLTVIKFIVSSSHEVHHPCNINLTMCLVMNLHNVLSHITKLFPQVRLFCQNFVFISSFSHQSCTPRPLQLHQFRYGHIQLVLKFKGLKHVIKLECETWSLTLNEERRLQAFENKALGRIFEPERGEVAGG